MQSALKRFVVKLTCLFLLYGGAVRIVDGSDTALPLGHRDFYPSPERPVGWRGDSTAAFPGATPVTTWNTKTGSNVVWKARMPSPSWGQPIVVGEKVFATADPNLLICVDVNTGRIIWQKEVDHTTLMPPEKARKAKEELAFFDSLFPVYVDACRNMKKMQALAKTKNLNGDELSKAVIQLGATTPPEYKSDNYDKAMADAELKPLIEELIRLRRDYAFAFVDPHKSDNWSALTGEGKNSPGATLKKLGDRLDALSREYSIWAWPRQNWYGCCSMTFATPCSDGQNVYVSFPNNQVACYDLNGVCKWMVWDPPTERKGDAGLFHTRFIPSPFLAGGVLVVNQNGGIRAFDVKNGRKIWGVWNPYKRGGQQSFRPFPEGSSPVLVRLPYQGKTMDFIADAGGSLYRLADGVVVCTNMPGTYKGQSPIVVGDLYIWKSGGDRSPYPIGVCRLKVVTPDSVECKEVWTDTKAQSGEFAAMVHGGKIYNANGVWDLMTGNRLLTIKAGGGWISPILAGEWVVGARGSQVIPAEREGPVIQNVMEDDISTVDPEWDRKVYCGQGGSLGNGAWYAAANRIFFRTAGHLWCIGDPKQPFQSPTKMPADARVSK